MGAPTKRVAALLATALVLAAAAGGASAAAVAPAAAAAPDVFHATDRAMDTAAAAADVDAAVDRVDGVERRSTAAARKALHFESKGGKLLANGKPFALLGVNWFGFETETALVHGLWTDQSMDSLLDAVASMGYNSLRVPLALDNLLANPLVTAFNGGVAANKQLNGKRMLDALDLLVRKAADRHLLILLDMHRLQAALWPDPLGLWYNDRHCEGDVVAAWTSLARRYCGSWNVFGADLLNEPHGANWGSGVHADDWRMAAERLGNAVVEVCPRLMIFVEGVGNPPVTPVVGPDWAFWGENLAGVCRHPVRLSDPSRLVYSPHVYGPSVARMDYFEDGRFPANLDAVWEAHFGSVLGCSDAAMVLGEFGGDAGMAKDRQMQERLVGWMRARGVGGFVWALNPNSGDTKGVLKGDWRTVDTVKKRIYGRLHATDVRRALADRKRHHG